MKTEMFDAQWLWVDDIFRVNDDPSDKQVFIDFNTLIRKESNFSHLNDTLEQLYRCYHVKNGGS